MQTLWPDLCLDFPGKIIPGQINQLKSFWVDKKPLWCSCCLKLVFNRQKPFIVFVRYGRCNSPMFDKFYNNDRHQGTSLQHKETESIMNSRIAMLGYSWWISDVTLYLKRRSPLSVPVSLAVFICPGDKNAQKENSADLRSIGPASGLPTLKQECCPHTMQLVQNASLHDS